MHSKRGPSCIEERGATPELAKTLKATLSSFSRILIVVLMAASLSSCLYLLGLDHYMTDEQIREYEQLRKMACVIVKNETPSSVYLVVDESNYGRIPPGSRAYANVQAGGHSVELYDDKAHRVVSIWISLNESERYRWVYR